MRLPFSDIVGRHRKMGPHQGQGPVSYQKTASGFGFPSWEATSAQRAANSSRRSRRKTRMIHFICLASSTYRRRTRAAVCSVSLPTGAHVGPHHDESMGSDRGGDNYESVDSLHATAVAIAALAKHKHTLQVHTAVICRQGRGQPSATCRC